MRNIANFRQYIFNHEHFQSMYIKSFLHYSHFPLTSFHICDFQWKWVGLNLRIYSSFRKFCWLEDIGEDSMYLTLGIPPVCKKLCWHSWVCEAPLLPDCCETTTAWVCSVLTLVLQACSVRQMSNFQLITHKFEYASIVQSTWITAKNGLNLPLFGKSLLLFIQVSFPILHLWLVHTLIKALQYHWVYRGLSDICKDL